MLARPKEIIPIFKRDVGGSSDIRLGSNLPRFPAVHLYRLFEVAPIFKCGQRHRLPVGLIA